MDRTTAVRWVRWLCSVEVPTEHIAIVLGLDPTEVDRRLATRRYGGLKLAPIKCPAWWYTVGPVKSRPIRSETGAYLRRLHELGYTVGRIAQILDLHRGTVHSFLAQAARAEAARVARDREREEARQRRVALAAARAVWERRDSRCDDADGEACAAPPRPPAAELLNDQVAELLNDQVVELVPAPEVLAPPPNPWIGSSRFQEGMASRKLCPDDRQRIHELRADGLSTGELAAIFGVSRSAICYSLAHSPAPCPGPPTDARETGIDP